MRPLLPLFVSLFFLLVSHAQAAERGALFRITLDGHEMHLFGTLHVGLPAFYPLEPRIVDALAQSSTLALEIDPALPQWELARALHSHGMLGEGSGAYEDMPPESKARLDKLILRGGLNPSTVKSYKPVLLATLLTMGEYTSQGFRPDLSSESWLAQMARKGNTRVLELESLGRQLSLLDRLGVPERWRFLDEMMATIESGAQRREARAMVEAWSTADRHALDEIAARCELDASVSGKFVTQVLLKERNIGLAESLLQLLREEKKTFAAVGVLHLLGKGSVPALLQEKGVSVERIY